MSDENKKPVPEAAVEKEKKLSKVALAERNASMFMRWVMGESIVKIAKDNNLQRSHVYQISKQDRWKDKHKKLAEEIYKKKSANVKFMASELVLALLDDVTARRAKQKKKKKYKLLSVEEQRHFSTLLEKLFREIRLDDGQPTDVTSGEVVHRIILPPGVKRLGVMPPNPNVKYVEDKNAEAKEIEKDDDDVKKLAESFGDDDDDT